MRHALSAALVALLVTAAHAQKIDITYKPHRVLLNFIKGHAVNAILMGNAPTPNNPAYLDLARATQRIDNFQATIFWVQNPPLTPFEARRLAGLEAWAKQTANPQADKRKFFELVYFQTKLAKFLKQRSELEVQIYLPDLGTTTRLKNWKMLVDLAPLPPAGYHPGLADGHVPQIVAVDQNTLGTLPAPWSHLWQPILLSGTFDGTYGQTGRLDARFIRHQSRLMVMGSLSPHPRAKLSVMAHASYHGENDPSLPSHYPPVWLKVLNAAGDNWKDAPIDWTLFSTKYADGK